MKTYKTKAAAEKRIKQLGAKGTFSPTWIPPHWYIMSNLTGHLMDAPKAEIKTYHSETLNRNVTIPEN